MEVAMTSSKKTEKKTTDKKASDKTVAKPDNPVKPEDPFGKPAKGEEWNRESMQTAMRKPAYKTDDGKTAKKQVDDLKDD